MKQKLINDVVQGMLPFLNNAQAERLQDVLQHALWRYEVCETTGGEPEQEQGFGCLVPVRQEDRGVFREISEILPIHHSGDA